MEAHLRPSMAKSASPSTEHLFSIITPDHHQLAAVLHSPAKKPKGLVILSHGFTGTKCETGRLFVTTARAMAAAGLAALRFDFWGSGDSSGEFYEMSPNSEISDLKNVIRWAHQQGYTKIGLLGLSYGGGVSICTAAQIPQGAVRALVTWSTVPGFEFWRSQEEINPKIHGNGNPIEVGKIFFTDRPKIDVPESFVSLKIPKLQIQGDNDIPGFRDAYAKFFPHASKPKKHVVVTGADHTFNNWKHRKSVINQTVNWFLKYL